MLKRSWVVVACCLFTLVMFTIPALAGPLDAWKPKFDPSGAKYKCIVSNISHPVIKGVYTGYAIRDELWKRTNGQIYLDYKPLAQLGGGQFPRALTQGAVRAKVKVQGLVGLTCLPLEDGQ